MARNATALEAAQDGRTNGDQQHNRGDIRTTEQQANDAIHLWAMYECLAHRMNWTTATDLPAGHKAIGPEKPVSLAADLEAQEPRARRRHQAAHALVEGVYQALERGDQRLVTHWYFGERGNNQKDAAAI